MSNAVLKDQDWLNLKLKIKVDKNTKERFLNTIKKDAEFLAKCNIMDYSLLVGVIENFKDSDSLKGSVKQSIRHEEVNVEVTNTHRVTMCEATDGVVYLMGIIDTFTEFNMKKKGEALVKGCFQGKNVSCIHPDKYAARFSQFITDQFE